VFKKNDVYSRNKHNLALNRLITLGTFKFVKARFEKADTVNGDYLNGTFYLTPTQKNPYAFKLPGSQNQIMQRADYSTSIG